MRPLCGPLNMDCFDHTRFILGSHDIATRFWMMHRLLDAPARATAAAPHLLGRNSGVAPRPWIALGERIKRACADLHIAMQCTSGPRNQQQSGDVESSVRVHPAISRKSLHRAGLSSRLYVDMDHAGQGTRRSLPPGVPQVMRDVLVFNSCSSATVHTERCHSRARWAPLPDRH